MCKIFILLIFAYIVQSCNKQTDSYGLIDSAKINFWENINQNPESSVSLLVYFPNSTKDTLKIETTILRNLILKSDTTKLEIALNESYHLSDINSITINPKDTLILDLVLFKFDSQEKSINDIIKKYSFLRKGDFTLYYNKDEVSDDKIYSKKNALQNIKFKCETSYSLETYFNGEIIENEDSSKIYFKSIVPELEDDIIEFQP